MEQQVVLLQEINQGIWALVYLVSAGVCLNLIRAIAASYRTIKSEIENMFYNTARAMYETGQYQALIDHCHEHLKKKPKDAYAYWFLGKAHFERKEYDQAVDYFNRTGELDPSWQEEWINPFLKRIETKRSSANQ